MDVATISLIILATALVAGVDQASGAASVDILDVVLSLKRDVTELTRKNEEQDSKIAKQDNEIAQQDRRIALQDDKIAQQDRRIALQDNEIAQQARRIAEQEHKISSLKKKRVKKESDITPLKKKVVEQENVITELKRKNNEHEDMVQELKRDTGNQEEETTEPRKAMQPQEDSHRRERQAPERVAFSVYLSHDATHAGIGEKVRFDAVLLNEGNGYNPHIAAFTAPTKGIYLFAYNIAKRLVGQAWVHLMKNGNVINSAAVEVIDTKYDNQHAGNVALVALDVGDVVYVEEYHQDDALIYGNAIDRFTTFSGVLLI